MTQLTALIPIGKITVAVVGTPVPLSFNCGPYGGQQGTDWKNPPVPGMAWRFMEIQGDNDNLGNLYLLPRGKTAAGNPGSILAKIPPGGSIPFPSSVMGANGFTPENFVLDSDAVNCVAYGYGSTG
jgi:hypothetical protein